VVKIFLVLVAAASRVRVGVAELAGASLLVACAATIYRPAALGVAGVCVLAKAFEWDLGRGEDG